MFENRKSTMMARWDRMAKAFTRSSKEIFMAARAGGDSPDYNPALRRAIQNARAVNMPKDKIENAIKKAMGVDTDDFHEVIYEGYASHGVAVLVVTATDNPTRTVSNVRNYFKKNGGNLGNSGSVAFMFNHIGVFKLDPATIKVDLEELELDLIDHGLEQLEHDTDDEGAPVVVLHCAFNDFGNLQSALEERGIEPKSSGGEYMPLNTTSLNDEQVGEVLKLVDRIEQDDDVQHVFHTLD